MYSKIEILSNTEKTYSWSGRKILPTVQYEWEKRQVVIPTEPEEETETKSIDIQKLVFENSLNITDNSIKLPQMKLEENYYIFKVFYLATIDEVTGTTEEKIVDYISYSESEIAKIDYNFKSNLPITFSGGEPNYNPSIRNLIVKDYSEYAGYQYKLVRRVNAETEVPAIVLRLMHEEHDKTEAPGPQKDLHLHDMSVNYAVERYYPEIKIFMNEMKEIGTLDNRISLFKNRKWSWGYHHSEKKWSGVNGREWVTHIWYYLSFPCYFDKNHRAWTIPNNGKIYDKNGTPLYYINNPEYIELYEKFKKENDYLYEWEVDGETWHQKAYTALNPYWRVDDCGTWTSSTTDGYQPSRPDWFYNINLFEIDFNNGVSITIETDTDKEEEQTPVEPEPQKGYVIQKVYSLDPNEFPEDDIQGNYWYVKVGSNIISYDNTDTYIIVNSDDYNGFPKKGIQEYNSNWYWFTYRGEQKKVLTTFDTDVLLDNVDYAQSANSTSQFTVGKVAGASIVFNVWKPMKQILQFVGYECRYYQKRKWNDPWINEGIFTIKEVQENGLTKTTVTAYDNTIKLSLDAKQLVEKFYYPITLYEVFIITSAYCDLAYDLNTYFPNEGMLIRNPIQLPTDMDEITCRNIIEWIAEMAGGIFVVDYDGKLLYKDMAAPVYAKGSNDKTNYSVNISKIPILKPTKVKYNNIEVVDSSAINYQDINVLDLSKNPFLAQVDSDLIENHITTVLNNIKSIGDIYPMEVQIDNDISKRQCGDAWIVDAGNEKHLSIITEKRINSNGIYYACTGDVIPYITEKMVSEDEISDLVRFYQDTFFKFFFNKIIFKDIQGNTVYTLDYPDGYIDEHNVKLNIKVPNIFDYDDEEYVEYNFDFTTMINELLFKEGYNATGPNGNLVSIIDNTLIIQDTNHWSRNIRKTKYQYNMRSYPYTEWDHKDNQILEVGNSLYSIKLVKVFTNNKILDDRADFFYSLTSIIKESGRNTFEFEVAHKQLGYYRVRFDDDKYAMFKLWGKPKFVLIKGMIMYYDDETDTVQFHVLANEKGSDDQHEGQYLTARVYIDGKKPALINAFGEPTDDNYYEGETKYIDDGSGITITRNGAANDLGILVSAAGNSYAYYAEGTETDVSVHVYTGENTIDESIAFYDVGGRQGYNQYYYQGDVLNNLCESTEVKIYSELNGYYKYYPIKNPFMIEYINKNGESTIFYENAYESRADIKSFFVDYDELEILTPNLAEEYAVECIRVNIKNIHLNINNKDIVLTLIYIPEAAYLPEELGVRKYYMFLNDDDYIITAYNNNHLSEISFVTLGTKDQLRTSSTTISRVPHDYGYKNGKPMNYSVSYAAASLIKKLGLKVWQVMEVPYQFYYVIKPFFSNGDPIPVSELMKKYYYIQIQDADSELEVIG